MGTQNKRVHPVFMLFHDTPPFPSPKETNRAIRIIFLININTERTHSTFLSSSSSFSPTIGKKNKLRLVEGNLIQWFVCLTPSWRQPCKLKRLFVHKTWDVYLAKHQEQIKTCFVTVVKIHRAFKLLFTPAQSRNHTSLVCSKVVPWHWMEQAIVRDHGDHTRLLSGV